MNTKLYVLLAACILALQSAKENEARAVDSDDAEPSPSPSEGVPG